METGAWFEDYIRSYIERDLKDLVQVRSLVEFRRFLSAAANRAGQLVNFTDMGRSCGVSPNTAKAWTAALETSGIINILPPWFENIETRLTKSPKLYFADTGLLCALMNVRDYGDLEKSSFAGAVWENFVFTELVKSGSWEPGRTLFFYRDHSGNEVDFIGILGEKRILVEAKSSQRIRTDRLGFSNVPLKATWYVAAPTGEAVPLPMKDYTLYDPRLSEGPRM
jgi:predicted AAA+ superfamily ATPase